MSEKNFKNRSRVLCSRVAGPAVISAIVAMIAVGSITDAAAKSRDEWKKEYQRPSEVPYPEENPYTTDKAELGHKLFFDPRLSGADYISCATCHNPSFSWGDGLPTGFGHKMTRLGRKTPTILNLAFGELMMWDGRFETLEEQALGPMQAPVEMNQKLESVVTELNAIPGYRSMFNIAFPGEGITVENIAKAIATYERTIVSGIAPFDRWVGGDETAISESAKRGFDIFNGKANCVACHSGWNFTDSSFHDIGLPDDDLGRGNELKSVVKMQHAFKTPTLRNVVERSPYMHDGSVPTLSDMIDHYATGGVKRPSLSDDMKSFTLTQDEKRDLVAFLKTLTGNDTVVFAPVLPPNSQDIDDQALRVEPASGGSAKDGNQPEQSCGSWMNHWRNSCQ